MKVPEISRPLPLTAGSHKTFGAMYAVVEDVGPNMSPSKPPPIGAAAGAADGAGALTFPTSSCTKP